MAIRRYAVHAHNAQWADPTSHILHHALNLPLLGLHSYAARVRTMQRFVRGQQAVTRSKLLLLTLQWRRLEMSRLAQQYGEKTSGSGRRSSSRQASAVQHGEYAGLPEELLDTPLPHVPVELRAKVLRKLLGEMRKDYHQAMLLWDQKVLLAAEMHPALAGGQSGLRQLSVIQHELLKKKAMGVSAAREYDSVMKIMSMVHAQKPDTNPFRKPDVKKPNDPKKQARSRLVRTSEALLQSRLALEEIRERIPRPHLRLLASEAKMSTAFDKAVDECRKRDEWQMRPIRDKREQQHGHGNIIHPAYA